MYLGSVPIDSRSGLGAEVAVSVVEIERTNAEFAAATLELDFPFDPIDGVLTHGSIVVHCSEGTTAPRSAVEGNLRTSLSEHHRSLWLKFPGKIFQQPQAITLVNLVPAAGVSRLCWLSTNLITRSTFERFLPSRLHPEVRHV